MFLNSLHHFRGIAILVIIFGHTYDMVPWIAETNWEAIIRMLISGGTYLFIFISGYLFHHVYYPRWDYRKFLRQKTNYVFIPYLVLGFLPTCYWVFVKQTGPVAWYIFQPGDGGIWYQYLRPFLWYYLSGAMMLQFWYIPFIAIIFLASPLFVVFIRLPAGWRLVVIAAAMFVSAQVLRPPENLFPWQSAVYFCMVYLVGMNTSLHREQVLGFLRGKEWLLLAIAVALGTAQVLLYGYEGHWKDPCLRLADWPWLKDHCQQVPAWPWMYAFQKFALCYFFLVLLARFESHSSRLLSRLADTSFALYFLHMFVINAFKEVFGPVGNPWVHQVIMWPVITVPMIVLTFYLATICKKLLGKRSRYIIGW